MSILRIIKLYIFLYFPYLVFNQTLGPLCRKLNEDFAHFSLNLLNNEADYSYQYTEDNRSYRIYFKFCALTNKQCRGSSSYGILFSLDSAGNDLNETCKQ